MRDQSAIAEPTYVLGTGVSHDGSTVLLRDGRVVVGIEKERLTRRKHDGGNDSAAVQYCLDAAGITLDDVALVVQAGLFTLPERDEHDGARPWADHPDLEVVTVSHHLAHAYSAIGTAPFDEFEVIVVDGCGSPRAHCIDDWDGTALTADRATAEKDSHYRWVGASLEVCCKDYSPPVDPWLHEVRLSSTRDSIGGFYAAVSGYCLGDMDDVGKLMGLAPYGCEDPIGVPAFAWEHDRLVVTDRWQRHLRSPRRDAEDFAARFQYFADVASWAQRQVTEAVCELVARRLARAPRRPLALSGGVALNAVANAALLDRDIVDELYIEPAAGDNGIALGCAFYGWLDVLGRPRIVHDGSTCFGRSYTADEVEVSIAAFLGCEPSDHTHRRFDHPDDLVAHVAEAIDAGSVVGWFQGGSEFGPRALGRRSILATPGESHLRDRINRRVKFREDFRPFAPSVRSSDAATYFSRGGDSPHMILVDQVRPEWQSALRGVMHVDGSARVQTVESSWNPRFDALLGALHDRCGIGVVLNTSFNKRGEPIVETPADALALYTETAIDLLVLDDHVITRARTETPLCSAERRGPGRSVERITAAGTVRRFSSRCDLMGHLGADARSGGPAPVGDELCPSMFHEWVRQGPTGCLFAQNRSRHLDAAGYHTIVSRAPAQPLDAHALQADLLASTGSSAVLIHLPEVRTTAEMASVIATLACSPHWFASTVACDDLEAAMVAVALRWPLPGTNLVSEVLGFLDDPSQPFTRRAPVATLMLRTRVEPDAARPETVHLAQLPYLDTERRRADFLWEQTQIRTPDLLAGELVAAAKAPITCVVPAAEWESVTR